MSEVSDFAYRMITFLNEVWNEEDEFLFEGELYYVQGEFSYGWDSTEMQVITENHTFSCTAWKYISYGRWVDTNYSDWTFD